MRPTFLAEPVNQSVDYFLWKRKQRDLNIKERLAGNQKLKLKIHENTVGDPEVGVPMPAKILHL